MWAYTVLEIYQRAHTADDSGCITGRYPWPTSGEPADWIEDHLVGYTQGKLEDVVILTPLWRLLWWKLKGVLDR